MNALTALTTGAGLALAFYGGLWLTLRALQRGAPVALLALSRLLRLGLAGVVFYGLVQHGAVVTLEGLAGFWLARTALLRTEGA